MLRPKDIYAYIRDYDRPAQNRHFIMMTSLSFITLSIIFVWDIFIGETWIKLGGLILTLIALAVAVVLALRTQRIQLIAGIICFAMIVFTLPVEFFTGGGVYGCTPIWYAFAFMYIGTSVRGKIKYVLLGANGLSAITCYIVASLNPWLLTAHDMQTAYLDSVASLIGVGVMLYMMVDIMSRLHQHQNELASAQRAQIEELNRAQNRFFSSMSHEIRTPINTIIGLNEMTLREEISDEVAENARNISAASRILLTTINDILDLSKIESGKMELVPVIYDLGEMLSELVAMIWIRAKDKDLAFHVNVDQSCPARLYGDEVRIKQVLINILNNAVKYTSKGSVTLSIQCTRLEGRKVRMVYTVEDTGMGIRKESIPHLFSAFKRVDEDKNRYIEGTGLGLSIVKQFVDLMGGTVSVNSVYTKGSTFIIELPQEMADDAEIGTLDLETRHGGAAREHYRQSFEAPKAHVLIVDDNDTNLLVESKLLRATKVQIDTVQSGAEALQMTLKTHYDVILMDHLMPGMDGIECLHAIRGQVGGLCTETPTVALTANAGSENQALYSREGFDGYLLKPVNGEQLESELIRLLPRELVKITGDLEMSGADDVKVGHRNRRVPIQITTETICDLPKKELEHRGIPTLPCRVQTDHGWFLDREEIETDGLISYMETGRHALTAEPELSSYETFFAEQLTKAQNIIHIAGSSRVSRGYEKACEAAANFDNVTIVDSGQISGGMGILVLEAYRLSQEENTPQAVIRRLEEFKPRVSMSYIVASTEYLLRAGRIKRQIHTLADTFLVHPQVEMTEGEMRVSHLWIGSKEHAWKSYLKSVLRHAETIDTSVAYLVCSGISLEESEEIQREVTRLVMFDRIVVQKVSPAISSNCGPGCFGIVIKRKERNSA
ncbi:MAG: DegV family EDD domain-containing protein [Butyrivibrio sp.]|nr:DegV family EDD domain-containing protein [Butyrivibrio sp.]